MITYQVACPSIRDARSVHVNGHHFPHVLIAGIRGNHIIVRRFVLFGYTWNKQKQTCTTYCCYSYSILNVYCHSSLFYCYHIESQFHPTFTTLCHSSILLFPHWVTVSSYCYHIESQFHPTFTTLSHSSILLFPHWVRVPSYCYHIESQFHPTVPTLSHSSILLLPHWVTVPSYCYHIESQFPIPPLPDWITQFPIPLLPHWVTDPCSTIHWLPYWVPSSSVLLIHSMW